MKALVGAFNQETALVGAFSVIVKSSGTFGKTSFQALTDTVPGAEAVKSEEGGGSTQLLNCQPEIDSLFSI